MAGWTEGSPIGRTAKPVLEQRGGIWHYRFTVAHRRFRGTTGERDRGRAESILAAKWYEAHRKAHLPVASGPGVALDLPRCAALWLSQLPEGERNPQYLARVKLDTRYIIEHFKLPGDVSNDAWQSAMRAMHGEGLSWASLRHATITLRHLMRFAAKLRAIPVAPELTAPANKLVAKEQAPRRALSARERDQVIAAMRRNGDARAARIWTAMAYSGLRRGELARLTWRWIDAKAGLIRVPATASKAGALEAVPLHPAVLRALRAEGKRDPDQPIFGGFDLRKAWARALKRAKVDVHGLTPHHSARHTYGTVVAQLAKGDLSAVQAAGRWRSLAMVARYVHADVARARAAVRRL